jgi:ATP-binding cassette subfamily A (ABC1) protein 3
MKGGEVSSVIDSLSSQVRDYGGTPQLFDSVEDLAMICRTGTSGGSPCYAAVVFHSSPSEGADSSTGTWNYTLRSVGSSWGGGFADIRSSTDGPQGSLLPLQRAVDQEITTRSQSANTSQLPDANVILFTDQDQIALEKSRTSNYLSLAIYVFGPVFVFTLIDIVYHMTSFVARERELGMSGLIDTMISGGSSIRGSLVRQVATYLSFAAIYLPSWLAVGIVVSVVIFPVESRGLPTGFFILTGLAFTSFSLFGASFFKKAQLSGSIMAVIIVVGAILPVVLGEQTETVSGLLSVLFPSSNLSYFITAIGKFEAAKKRVSMTGSAQNPDDVRVDTFRLPLYAHWVIVVVHIVIFPVLAFAVEHLFHSTASKHRRFAQPASPDDPTVILTSFSKTYVHQYLFITGSH